MSSHSVAVCVLFIVGLISPLIIVSISGSQASVTVSLISLSNSLFEQWFNQRQPVPSCLLLFWTDISCAKLSPPSEWICAHREAQLTWTWSLAKYRNRDERWFSATYGLPSLRRIWFNLTAKSLHRQWALAVLCSILNFPLVGDSLGNLIWNTLWFPQREVGHRGRKMSASVTVSHNLAPSRPKRIRLLGHLCCRDQPATAVFLFAPVYCRNPFTPNK